MTKTMPRGDISKLLWIDSSVNTHSDRSPCRGGADAGGAELLGEDDDEHDEDDQKGGDAAASSGL